MPLMIQLDHCVSVDYPLVDLTTDDFESMLIRNQIPFRLHTEPPVRRLAWDENGVSLYVVDEGHYAALAGRGRIGHDLRLVRNADRIRRGACHRSEAASEGGAGRIRPSTGPVAAVGGDDARDRCVVSLIEVEGLRAGFGMTQALAGVDLAFESGQLVAVVGPSGSGKSTLLNCLGLHRPDSGAVFFDGRPLGRLGGRIGQPSASGRSDWSSSSATWSPSSRSLRMSHSRSGCWGSPEGGCDWAGDLLDQLGIADVSDQLPAEVSGGQMQRAALARALVHRPQVLFADEPTGALDSVNAALVLDALFEHTMGALVIVVTRRNHIGGALRSDDHLRDGLVASDGSVRAVATR